MPCLTMGHHKYILRYFRVPSAEYPKLSLCQRLSLRGLCVYYAWTKIEYSFVFIAYCWEFFLSILFAFLVLSWFIQHSPPLPTPSLTQSHLSFEQTLTCDLMSCISPCCNIFWRGIILLINQQRYSWSSRKESLSCLNLKSMHLFHSILFYLCITYCICTFV